MGKKKTNNRIRIREFSKGHHQDDMELEEDYMDWFFLHHFGKGPNFWKSLPDDKIMSIMTLEQDKQQEYWSNWQTMFKSMFGK